MLFARLEDRKGCWWVGLPAVDFEDADIDEDEGMAPFEAGIAAPLSNSQTNGLGSQSWCGKAIGERERGLCALPACYVSCVGET